MVLNKIKSAVEIYSHLSRYRQIFFVFFKYGFADFLKLVHLQKLLEIQDSHLPLKSAEIHHKPAAERFRMALEELGPTFVKFGQILSTRRDLIDEVFQNELKKLQDQVPPFPAEEAKRIFEEELQSPISELFKEFDDQPIASASMAQVHRAVLIDETEVAIKIQRPNIETMIETDLAILVDVARFLEKYVEEIAVLDPVGVVREFSKTILEEQDFAREAQNMERFAKQFRGNRMIKVPRVCSDLVTTRILTMEYVTGYRVDRLEELRKHGIDPVKLSERIAKLIFQQIFQHGFFHADPHPGNMAVLPGGVPCLYDYGMMGSLSSNFREDIASMILGLTQKDPRRVTRALLGMSREGLVEDMRKLESDVEAFGEEHLDRPLKDLKLGFILNRLLDLLMEHKLRMKADFYLGIKALTQVEAAGVALNPNLNFIQFGQPYATEILQEKYSLTKIWKDLLQSFSESWDFLKDLPRDAQDLYRRIQSGKYSIPIEHRIDPQGFEPLRKTLNHVSNQLTGAIMTSSVLICSGLLILADVPPLWHEIPVLGIAGLALAAIMGVRLFISTKKGGGS